MSGLAAVSKCALPSGVRATVLTRPVVVIDIAVCVLASVQATDTHVGVILRWGHLKYAFIGRVLDGSQVTHFVQDVYVNSTSARGSSCN